jgi:hypothetical protein
MDIGQRMAGLTDSPRLAEFAVNKFSCQNKNEDAGLQADRRHASYVLEDRYSQPRTPGSAFLQASFWLM